MGLLSKLFSRPPKRPSVGSGKISMYKMTLQQNHGLSSQRCGLDGRTFPCPSITWTVSSSAIDRFALDVGGYCPQCGQFRCHEHVEFRPVGEMIGTMGTFGIYCVICDKRVSGVKA